MDRRRQEGEATPPQERPEEIVRRGYDRAAERYAAARDQLKNERHLRLFTRFLPPPAEVLDIGCGSGRPIDASLIELGYTVAGIDNSARQIELARRLVPRAHFEVRDMLDLAEGEYRVDGIVAFYAIFHIPRDRHAALLGTLRSFLRPGGVLLATMGGGMWEGSEPDFHGVEMYWSHFDPPTNRTLVEAAGFSIELDEMESETPGERHQVILARKA